MDMPLTAHTRLVLNLARQQATRLHAARVADEHVLLAILRADEPGIGQMALRKLGIDPVALTESLEAAARREPRPQAPHQPHQNDPDGELSRLVAGARREAAEMHCAFAGSEHLLMALLRASDGAASQVLGEMGITVGAVRSEVFRLLGLDGPGERCADPHETRRHDAGTVSLPRALLEKTDVAGKTDVAPPAQDSERLAQPCSRRIEALLSQQALWSQHPDILETFDHLGQLLARATDTAISELDGLDLPQALVDPAIAIFRRSQEKAVAVADADFARAGELRDEIERIVARQAAMPTELVQVANELIKAEREKQIAVQEERYEQAAQCRDRSRRLRSRWEKLSSAKVGKKFET